MLESFRTGKFKKEFERAEKRHQDIDKLIEVMGMIINEQPLPPERHNHPLQGKWKKSLECHIQGDWVLVYEIDEAARVVTFQRTGSHSDLFSFILNSTGALLRLKPSRLFWHTVAFTCATPRCLCLTNALTGANIGRAI